jgi:hypothetical protein
LSAGQSSQSFLNCRFHFQRRLRHPGTKGHQGVCDGEKLIYAVAHLPKKEGLHLLGLATHSNISRNFRSANNFTRAKTSGDLLANHATRAEALAAGGDEAKRAFDVMMGMKKIDVAAIEAARRG